MSLSDALGEARMRDVRRHQKKPPSGSQVRKLFKNAMQAMGSLSSGLGSMGAQDLARQVDELAGRIRGISNRVTEEDLAEGRLPVYPFTVFDGFARHTNNGAIAKWLKARGVISWITQQSTTNQKAVFRWNVYSVDGEDPSNMVGEYVIEMRLKKVSDKPKGKGPPGGMGM